MCWPETALALASPACATDLVTGIAVTNGSTRYNNYPIIGDNISPLVLGGIMKVTRREK